MGYETGDWVVATLTVDPYDGSTAATLTVTDPDGTTTTPNVSSSGGGQTWTADPYELTTAGEWVERWAVTGTGRSVEHRVLLVAPSPTHPTSQRVYATTSDYAHWLHTAPPAGARRALARASLVVEEMTDTAVYDTDDDGMPTDPVILAAMRDATCAQAEHARTSGDSDMVGATPISAMTIGSVSVTRGQPSGGRSTGLPPHWAPTALRILASEGLTNQPPWSY